MQSSCFSFFNIWTVNYLLTYWNLLTLVLAFLRRIWMGVSEITAVTVVKFPAVTAVNWILTFLDQIIEILDNSTDKFQFEISRFQIRRWFLEKTFHLIFIHLQTSWAVSSQIKVKKINSYLFLMYLKFLIGFWQNLLRKFLEFLEENFLKFLKKMSWNSWRKFECSMLNFHKLRICRHFESSLWKFDLFILEIFWNFQFELRKFIKNLMNLRV